MPNVGWSLEQRVAVKRWTLLASLFAMAGFVLSVVLVTAGNSGGWVLLFLTLGIYGPCRLCIGNIKRNKRKQPR
ncbi:hypothetical protein [Streptomyces sp. NPDC003522]